MTIEGCGGSGAVLCEITLDKDTHVCLNNDFLSTVTLNSSTELTVSTNTISSPLCIEYCRGSAQQHKYVLIDEDKCTCATDITFDIERYGNTGCGVIKRGVHTKLERFLNQHT